MSDVYGAHCFRPLCSHPCRWDTERRGITRHTPARVQRCSPKDDIFPSLSVVNVSEWAGRRRASKERLSYSEESLTDLPIQTEDTGKIKRADLSFPESISSTLTDTQNKIKLNTVYISPFTSCSEFPPCPVVTWIPNPHHKPQWRHLNKSRSPNIAIKELICLPSCQMSKSSNAAHLRKRGNVGNRREQRGRNSTLESAGTPRRLGIGFPPIPNHHLSRNIPVRDNGCGSLDQKLPSLTTTHPNHSSLSLTLSLSLGSVKCWRRHRT
ncbi:uncharacterized protein LOC120481174 isoform X2 [Pimephales promelas]|uniref:uncharacterized protein LOC120481174 isoform X2 n=1 Tax=Pimephales promelas TaxID=90988 RepID=UPI001955C8D9|nr:uncharacterized protein LOC120481174 isoform X2 [Pimephales promelas]KAG1949169.1 hypothetical protein F2P79_011980 [Pimephales promelas]